MLRSIRIGLLASVCVLAIAPWARAEDSPDQAASAVVGAFESGASLAEWARQPEPDLWLVAEALLARGKGEAAEALAKSADKTLVGDLTAWVQKRSLSEPSNKAWKSYLALEAATERKDIASMVREVEALRASKNAVLWIASGPHQAALITARDQQMKTSELLNSLGNQANELDWLEGARRSWDASGMIAWNARRMPEAATAWAKVLQVDERRKQPLALISSLNRLGMAEQRAQQMDASKEHLARALQLSRDTKDENLIARGLANLAITLRKRSEFEAAQALFEEAVSLAEKRGNQMQVARLLNDLASVAMQRGAFSEAVTRFERAIELKTRLGATASAMQSRVGLASLYSRLGRPDRAFVLLKMAEPLVVRSPNRGVRAAFLISLATAESDSGHTKEAQARLNAGLAEFTEPGDARARSIMRHNLAALSLNKADVTSAIEEMLASKADFEAHGNEFGAIHALTQIGVLQMRRRAYDQSIATLREAVDRADAIGDTRSSVNAREMLAGAYGGKQDAKNALRVSRDAIARSQTLLRGHADGVAGAIRGKYRDMYDVAIWAAWQTGDIQALHAMIEAGRSAALVEAWGGRDALSWMPIDKSLRQAEASAFESRGVATAALARAIGARDKQGAASALKTLRAAERKLANASEAIARASKSAKSVLYPTSIPLAQLQKSLQPKDVLVSYAMARDLVALALVVTATDARVVELAQSSDIAALVDQFNADVDASIVTSALDALRASLIAPLQLKPDTRRILISPDGNLAFVPFRALVAKNQSVTFVPSGTAYVRLLSGGQSPGRGVLALGDPNYREAGYGTSRARRSKLTPLPATRDEAKAIGDVVLLGDDATPTKLLAAIAKRPRWSAVHLACHGVLDVDDPYANSLAMTPEPATGGHLSMRDVMRASIPSDLIVLSACESGRGRVLRGEGVFGLVRAFLIAGSPRVVASLWRVDDEATAALMKAFYKHRKAGVATAEALSRAQDHVRAQAPWAHPKFWAAWVLWGLPN